MEMSFFETILKMSFTGSFVILVVGAVRFFLRKAPKVYSYALWAIVLFRLLCPVSFESTFSVVPEKLSSGSFVQESIMEHTVEETYAEYSPNEVWKEEKGQDELQISEVEQVISSETYYIMPSHTLAEREIPILFVVWCLGILLLVANSVHVIYRIRKKVAVSVRLHDNVYLAQDIKTPFTLGVFCPRIYLPEGLKEKEQEYIVAHEKYHIRRKDHLIKIVAYIVLCIHWFNPLVWYAFFAAGKDMEMSCDEAVMRKAPEDIRAEYSVSLLNLATGREVLAMAPLAFGEGNVKGRIKNVLAYKKAAVWVGALAGVLCLAVCVMLFTNPARDIQVKSGDVIGDFIFNAESQGDTTSVYIQVEVTEVTEKEMYPDGVSVPEGYVDGSFDIVVYDADGNETGREALVTGATSEYGVRLPIAENPKENEELAALFRIEQTSQNLVYAYPVGEEYLETYYMIGEDGSIWLVDMEQSPQDGEVIEESAEQSKQVVETDISFDAGVFHFELPTEWAGKVGYEVKEDGTWVTIYHKESHEAGAGGNIGYVGYMTQQEVLDTMDVIGGGYIGEPIYGDDGEVYCVAAFPVTDVEYTDETEAGYNELSPGSFVDKAPLYVTLKDANWEWTALKDVAATEWNMGYSAIGAFGHTLKGFLDGDEKEDTICYAEVYSKDSENGNWPVPQLIINGKDYGDVVKASPHYVQDYTDSPSWYGVFDLDKSDSYREIFLSSQGPSGDPQISVFRYDGKMVTFIGSTDIVVSTERFILDHAGKMETQNAVWFPENNYVSATYYLDKNGAFLEAEKEEYELLGRHEHALNEDLTVYTEKETSSKAVTLKAGEDTIDFCAYAYGKDGFEYWVTVETGNGETYYMPMVGYHELEDGRIIDDVVADMYRAG